MSKTKRPKRDVGSRLVSIRVALDKEMSETLHMPADSSVSCCLSRCRQCEKLRMKQELECVRRDSDVKSLELSFSMFIPDYFSVGGEERGR